MWKYVSRRIRDTFERSINQFEKRSAAGIATPGDANDAEQSKKQAGCRWICLHKCWASSSQGESNTNSKNWNFEHLNRTWIGAITWSSALVVGWYTSQLIHLKYKYSSEHQHSCPCPTKNNFISPYIQKLSPLYLKSVSKNLIGNLAPTVYLISNEKNDVKNKCGSTDSASSNDDGDLGYVLNSIENRLGLAAIENGQHEEGLNLLRSAANRNHAPALYNLGLCYEMGLGVLADEKMAMELYRSAAALEHPGALYNLGVYYGQGRGGLARDARTGRRLLRLAAAQGQPDAAAALGALVDDLDTCAPPATAASPTPTPPPPPPPPPPLPYAFCAPYEHVFVPSQTTLFVENVTYNQSSVY